MKKRASLSLLLCMLLLCACGKTQSAPAAGNENKAVRITLAGDTASVKGGGASVNGSTVTVGSVGEYRLTGTLTDGQIVVDTGENAVDVTLVLDGADISNSAGPALWVKQAKNVHVVLAANSQNRLSSGVEADLASYDEGRSGAAVFSEDDLVFEGEGALAVYGYLNNGVTCKDDLKIKGGALTVLSANNGVRASESIAVSGGALSVTAGNDGIKTSSDAKQGKGYIEISDGSIRVASGGDAIAAVTELRVTGGTIQTESRRELVTLASRKGLKAGTLLEITGGSLEIRADEDGLHCDGDVRVTGGSLYVAASTGVQSGVKGSGVGDIALSGGSVFLSAAKQAMKAEGGLAVSGELLALCNSEKQAVPDAGGQAWLLAALEGSAGETLQIGGQSYSVPQRFTQLYFTAPGVAAGETLTVRLGERSYTQQARQ